jgi:hypothetical protein
LLATVVCVAAVLAAPSAASAAPADPHGCTPLPRRAHAGPHGTTYVTTQAGSRYEQRVPPRGWRPLTATDAELAYYRLPARPTDPAKLRAWTGEWSHYAPMTPVRMCVDHSHAHSAQADRWSGMITQGRSDFTEAYANVKIADTIANCMVSSWVTSWVGLGGWNSKGLLQNGYDDGPGALGDLKAWWEAIDTNGVDAGVIFLSGGLHMLRGDSMNMATTYNAAAGTVQFGWHDLNTGEVVVIGPLTGINGKSTRNYYNGATADYIIERVGSYDLRDYQYQLWANASAKIADGTQRYVGNWDHTGIDMREYYEFAQQYLYRLSHLHNDAMTTSASWRMDWENCGNNG